MQRYIDDEILAGISAIVLVDNQPVYESHFGLRNVEAGEAMTADTIYRIYSNTKIVTSVAAMCLFEDGKFGLDDTLDQWFPKFANLRVLREPNSSPDDTVPLQRVATVRELMSHNAGFSYGIFQESSIDRLYVESGVIAPTSTLAEMEDRLANIPLANQPGARWQYSVSTDLLARLVEIWSGKSFPDFLESRIFGPLGMVDTGFIVPAGKAARFAENYAPHNPLDPMAPGFSPAPDALIGSYLEPKPMTSGGGGLVGTILDYTRFMQMLGNGGEWEGVQILQPGTVAMMHTNQLPEGMSVNLPNWVMPDTQFGLGLAIKAAPAEGEPSQAIGEYHWGGMAGTHSFIAPAAGITGLLFTQRMPGFWHPFYHEFKRLVYQAAA
ncbi:MAG: penicillin-binding protein [Gammaproteobacteria bacterium]|nr:penicillin-binding protein [Gammaproteobacteria bacterium]